MKADEGQAPEDAGAGDQIDVVEENIYEVMKGHIQRKKEELEARNAQLRQQAAAGASPASPALEKVADVSDLPAVWTATRNWLSVAARYLDSVLGHCGRLESLDSQSGEAVLLLPANQRGFANEKARSKIEEGLRAVTGLGIRLALAFSEKADEAPPGVGAGMDPDRSRDGSQAAFGAAQRVPAEVNEAVLQQPVVQELMKKLDARLVNIELLETGGEE